MRMNLYALSALTGALTLINSAAQVTYVDAVIGTNTTLADGSALVEGTDYVVDDVSGDGRWDYRSFGNGNKVISSNNNGSENCPALRVTITGLDPEKFYEVYAYTWGSNGSTNWRLRASLTDPDADGTADGQVDQGWNTNHFASSGFDNTAYVTRHQTTGINTGPLSTDDGGDPGLENGGYFTTSDVETTEGNRSLYQATLGQVQADGNGEIPVYIDDLVTNTSSFRTFFDGVGYMEVSPLPTIDVQPSDVSVVPGLDATFTVSASAPSPLTQTYQWRKGGVDLPGETGETLTIPAADLNDAGDYDVVVSNPEGSTTSATAALNFALPAVTPAAQVAFETTSAEFTIPMPEGPVYTFQWRKDGVDLPGATGQTLSVSGISGSDAGLYDVEVTLGDGPLLSDTSGELVVPAVPTANYTTTINGDNPVAYWRLGEMAGATVAIDNAIPVYDLNIPGTSTAFELDGALLGDANTAMGFDGTTNSYLEAANFASALNPAAFTVEFWARPTGGTGRRMVFGSRNFVAVDFVEGYEVGLNAAGQWEFRTGQGDNGVGGPNAWNTLTGPAAEFNAWNHVVATFDGSDMNLFVNGLPAGTLGAVTFTPQTANPVYLGASANETVPGEDIFVGGIDEVAIYDTALSASDALDHYTAAFDPTLLPIVESQPQDQPVLVGEEASFSVSALSVTPLTYQWRQNGVDLPGATSDTLVVGPVALGDAGTYDCVVTNANGSSTSDAATLVPLVNYTGTIVLPDASNTILVRNGSSDWFAVEDAGAANDGDLWNQRSVFAILPDITPYGYQGDANTTDLEDSEIQTTITGLTPGEDYAVWTLISSKSTQVLTRGIEAAFAGGPLQEFLIADMKDTGLGSVALPGSGGDVWNVLHGYIGVETADGNGEIKVNVDYLAPGNRTVYNGLGYQLAAPVATPPVISVNPPSQTVVCGQDVTFSVEASSLDPISYQWQFNGVDIPGATESTLTVTGVDETVAGEYTALLTNAQGTVTSSVANLVTVLNLVGNFVFPDDSNTVLTRDGMAPFANTDQATATLNGLWTERADFNIAGLSTSGYFANATNEDGGDIEVRTAITGLTPGEEYAVWLLFGFRPGNVADRIGAALEAAVPEDTILRTLEDANAQDTGLTTAGGGWTVYHALLGVKEADPGGEIAALVDFRGLTNSAYLGLGYQEAVISSIPEPSISIENLGSEFVVRWPVGSLEQSNNLEDWTPLPAASPYVVPADTRSFFRAVK